MADIQISRDLLVKVSNTLGAIASGDVQPGHVAYLSKKEMARAALVYSELDAAIARAEQVPA